MIRENIYFQHKYSLFFSRCSTFIKIGLPILCINFVCIEQFYHFKGGIYNKTVVFFGGKNRGNRGKSPQGEKSPEKMSSGENPSAEISSGEKS